MASWTSLRGKRQKIKCKQRPNALRFLPGKNHHLLLLASLELLLPHLVLLSLPPQCSQLLPTPQKHKHTQASLHRQLEGLPPNPHMQLPRQSRHKVLSILDHHHHHRQLEGRLPLPGGHLPRRVSLVRSE